MRVSLVLLALLGLSGVVLSTNVRRHSKNKKDEDDEPPKKAAATPVPTPTPTPVPAAPVVAQTGNATAAAPAPAVAAPASAGGVGGFFNSLGGIIQNPLGAAFGAPRKTADQLNAEAEINSDPTVFKQDLPDGTSLWGRLTDGQFIPLANQPSANFKKGDTSTGSAARKATKTPEELEKEAAEKKAAEAAEAKRKAKQDEINSLHDKLVKALVKKLDIKLDDPKDKDPILKECEFDDDECMKLKQAAIAKHLLRKKCREDSDSEECDLLRDEDDRKAHNGVPTLDKALLDKVPQLANIPGLRFGAPPVNHTAIRLQKEAAVKAKEDAEKAKIQKLEDLRREELKKRDEYWQARLNSTAQSVRPDRGELERNLTREIEERVAEAVTKQRVIDAQREIEREGLFNASRIADRIAARRMIREEAEKIRRGEETIREQAKAVATVDWEYGSTSPGRPDRWGSLRDTWSDCDGKNQSPVDIFNSLTVGDLPAIKFHYNPVEADLSFDGRVAQSIFSYGSTLEYRGTEYNLKKMVFHTPSEHVINGVRFPMELQLVHSSEGVSGTGAKTTIVSILFIEGKPLPSLAELMNSFPGAKGEVRKLNQYNPNGLLESPDHWQYYEYSGSLTSPPCTEGINWVVLKHLKEASMPQIDHVRAVIGDNFRPVQNANGRIIRNSPN